jgi:hypothetical protein
MRAGWAIFAAVVLLWLFMCSRSNQSSELRHAHGHEPDEPEAKEAILYGTDNASPVIDLIGGSYAFARAASASDLDKLRGEKVLTVDMSTGKVGGDASTADIIVIKADKGLNVWEAPRLLLEPTLARHNGNSIVVDRRNGASPLIKVTFVTNRGPSAPVPHPLELNPTQVELQNYKTAHEAWERGEDPPKPDVKPEIRRTEIRIP